MLRLEEVQFVNWGPLRPDPVPFMTDTVNLITGTNGSAKTCFVNGIKVLLGVRFPKGSEPREYIFNPLALQLNAEMGPADQAVLRGTFCNPYTHSGHRFFSWEGAEFEAQEHATVICVVRHDSIRYRILPGRICWIEPISESLGRFLEENPLGGQKWRGPQVYDQILSRMGVSQAMRGVLALPQGETGEILKKSPTELLKTILQLTGKQDILDAYASQRKKYELARAKHRETVSNLELEKGTLAKRSRDAEKYEEWNEHRRERDELRDLLIPAADYRDRVEQRDRLAAEYEGFERRVKTNTEALKHKEDALPEREVELAGVRGRLRVLRSRRDSSARRQSRLEAVGARLDQSLVAARIQYEHSTDLIGQMTDTELNEAARRADQQWRNDLRALDSREREIADLNEQAGTLRSGLAAAPEEVQKFRTNLRTAGIESVLVADVLEPASTPARQVEAALGDAIWALVVSEAKFGRAVLMARDAQYRFPLARAGSGHPVAVLAGLRAPDDLNALLADLDVPTAPDLGTIGISATGAAADGFFHLPAMVHLRASKTARLGRASRAERLAEIERRLPAVAQERVQLVAAVQESHRQVQRLLEAVQLWPMHDEIRLRAEHLGRRARLAIELRRSARVQQAERLHDADELASVEGELRARLDQLRQQIEQEKAALSSLRNQRAASQGSLQLAQEAVDGIGLSDSQRQAFLQRGLEPTAELHRRMERVERWVIDEDRYPTYLRTEQVLADRDEQHDVVERAETTLGTVEQDMLEHQNEVDRARERYDNNVNAIVRLFDNRFREVCQSAGMQGELHRIAGDSRGEYGLDVRAAHKAGDRLISYQRRNFHSGGQTVKIAILLLLAAMSMGEEGSAEMLIMDEPIAHMSVENADQIAEVITSLKDRAQFILAMPTNAETLRVHWAEWQISLLVREPGELRAPQPQILSNLDVDTEARFASPQLALQTA